jgi:hypothetical protein
MYVGTEVWGELFPAEERGAVTPPAGEIEPIRPPREKQSGPLRRGLGARRPTRARAIGTHC